MVYSVDEAGSLTQDFWSYRVVAEDSTIGFRATRLGIESKIPSKEILDIALGGEIFLLKENDKVSVFSVGVNASNHKVQSGRYICKKRR